MTSPHTQVTLDMLYSAPRWRDVRWRGLTDAAHPVWQCAFRPFFALAVLAAPGLMLLWVAFLALGLPLPASAPGGPYVWHAHELLFGVGGAAAAGFALTAAPEFTDTPEFAPRPVQRLVLLWLAARLAFWCSGLWAPLALLS
ncbi:MAG: NnrS family protein, partial [Ottowia sp.]|nr:NnrS family protein [Ottowia sp.]